MEVSGQRHVLPALSLGLNRYPWHRRLGRLQDLTRRVQKFSPPTWIRSPNCPVRSEPLYLPCCPLHYFQLETEFVNIIKFIFRPHLVPALASLKNCVP